MLGADESELDTHAGNIERGRAAGLVLVCSSETDRDTWTEYEDTYHANLEAFVAAHPDDPVAPHIRRRIESWRPAFLRWGRDTLGFALYRFRRRMARRDPAASGRGTEVR